MGNYSSAASDMDDYIYVYPNSEDLPYVYYLRVLFYYMQINKVQLGQQTAYKTLELATEYINLFPDSEYIDEIKEKAKLITEHISTKEYSIAAHSALGLDLEAEQYESMLLAENLQDAKPEA
ncbi:competence protein ComL [Trichonephila clavata]|uniref:Competence protein ComL n=1 Tax=Trichonephila clavata TaxID=2740835 RepID=A0A8X6LRT2_TRICU|nr:competence protein ComL [Trichonephila clavata]